MKEIVYCDAEHRFDAKRLRIAVEGLRLCEGCRVGVQRDLGVIPELWSALRSGVARPVGGLGRSAEPMVSGTRDVGLVYDAAALNCAEQISRDIAYFAKEILGRHRSDVVVGCVVLRRYLDRTCGHELAGNVRAVTRSLVGQAYAILDPAGRPKEIGPCHEFNAFGDMCTGTLLMRGEGAQAALVCGVCGVRVPPRQWKRYGEMYKSAKLTTAEDVRVEGDVL